MIDFKWQIKSIFFVIAQLSGCILLMLTPGMFVLEKLFNPIFRSWPVVLVLANAIIISSLIMVLFEYLVIKIKHHSIKKLITFSWCIIVSICAYGYIESLTPWDDTGFFKAVLYLLGTALFFCLVMPLNKYPGIMSLNMGDLPAFYNMAKNIHNGKEYRENYFIGDYAEGGYVYLKQCPISVFVTAFFFNIFSVNRFSLQIYSMLTGLFCVLTGATLICQLNLFSTSPNDLLPYLVILFLTVPTFFIYCGVGEHSLPVSLSVLTMCYSMIVIQDHGVYFYILLSLNLLFIFFYRPEGRLIVLIFLTLLPFVMFKGFSRGLNLIWGLYIGVGFLSIIYLPRIIDSIPQQFKDFSFFYSGYNSQNNRFEWKFNGENSLDNHNKFNTMNHFIKDKKIDKYQFFNKHIGMEIKQHPWPFIKFVSMQFIKSLNMLFNSVTIPRNSYRNTQHQVIVAMFTVGMAIGIASNKTFIPYLLCAFLYLASLQLLNNGIIVRHVIPVSFLLFSLFVHQIINLSHIIINEFDVLMYFHDMKYYLVFFVLFILISNYLFLLLVRLDSRNFTYVGILYDLKKIIQKGDVILSSYAQLFSCTLGNYSVGTGFLKEFLPEIIERYKPDIIVFDNAREDCPGSYDHNSIGDLKSYEVIVNNKAAEYAILKKINRQDLQS